MASFPVPSSSLPRWDLEALIKIHINDNEAHTIRTVFQISNRMSRYFREWTTQLSDHIVADRNAHIAFRSASRASRRLLEPYTGDLLKKISYTYPSATPEWGDMQSEAFEPFKLCRADVQHLQLAIRPSNEDMPGSNDPLLTHLLKLPRLEVLTISLLPIVKVGSPLDSPFEFQDMQAHIQRLWSWTNHNLLDHSYRDAGGHHRALVRLREALEESGSDLESLHTLRFTNMSITGVQALRYSAFGASISANMPGDGKWRSRFWAKISSLSIQMVPWWRLPEDASSHKIEQPFKESGSVAMKDKPRRNAFSEESQDLRRLESLVAQAEKRLTRKEKDEYRQGVMQLHDWLKGFSSNLEELTWSWVKPQIIDTTNFRPCNNLKPITYTQWMVCASIDPELKDKQPVNPLLLDSHPGGWFSSPSISWEKLTHLAMAGTLIGQDELELFARRMKHIQKLWIPSEFVDRRKSYQVRHDSQSNKHNMRWLLLDPPVAQIDDTEKEWSFWCAPRCESPELVTDAPESTC